MKTVAVLMSTYNGEKFLKEQIDSILNQADVDVTLYIRDDGSSDSTVEIIDRYLENGSRIHFIEGENLGVGNSFMELVYQVPQDYDFYAFADQDDIWLGNKLSRAAEIIGENPKPVLYCSNQMLVDAGKKRLGLRHPSAPDTSWIQILCINKLSGCTMVWNSALQTILAEPSRRPSCELLIKRIQDVWVGMVASVTGEIIYDPEAFILYRQHDRNVVGVKEAPLWKEWRKKLINPKLRNGRSALAREIAEKCGDLITDPLALNRVQLYGRSSGTVSECINLLRDREICRHTGEKQWQYRIKVLLGLF